MGALGGIFSILSYCYFFIIFLEFTAFIVNAGKQLSWNGNMLSAESQATFSMLFPYNIDYPVNPAEAGSVMWNLFIDCALLLAWTVPHSILARPDVKTKFGADPSDKAGLYRSVYVFIATSTLHLFMRFWQPLYATEKVAPVWDVSSDPLWNKVLICGYLFGVLWLLSATFAIDHFELTGIKQATGFDLYALCGLSVEGFTSRWHYGLVRHPIMTGWFLMFFCVPTMTVNHLFFSIGMSAFIISEVKFYEEPRLKDAFPIEYGRYQRNTGAYCPMPFMNQRKDDTFTPLVEREHEN